MKERAIISSPALRGGSSAATSSSTAIHSGRARASRRRTWSATCRRASRCYGRNRCGSTSPSRCAPRSFTDSEPPTTSARRPSLLPGERDMNGQVRRQRTPGPPQRRVRLDLLSGRQVIQVENDYDKEVYNGDLGVVSRIGMEDGELGVDFEGREVPYG